MLLDQCDDELTGLIHRYAGLLELPEDNLTVTTVRSTYAKWLNRRIPSSYGGAYCFLQRSNTHAILINLERIDLDQPRSLEIVAAEELIHMRDHLDGDHRRHAHHGYDRIAVRVATLTGATPDEIRSALLPVRRRALKYLYQCPGCGMTVGRKRKGTWSCGRCSPRFDRRYLMRMVQELTA